MPLKSNDHVGLSPSFAKARRVLEFELPSVEIGVAEYVEGPTGCTVLYFPRRARCAIDVRGGSPVWLGDYGWTDAVCLSGGSAYGLEAAVGVGAELLAQTEYSPEWNDIALVSGAVIFDLGTRDNIIYPDKALGRAALRSRLTGRFPLGRHGAGCSATAGKGPATGNREYAGQGGAFRQVGVTRVLVVTVVNAIGVIVDRSGMVVRGNRDPVTGERRPLISEVNDRLQSGTGAQWEQGNTTLTAVVTNQAMDERTLRQLARQVHSSMARAIQPFHAPHDGDVLFAVSTDEVENPELDGTSLGLVVSELAWDAVLNSFDPDE